MNILTVPTAIYIVSLSSDKCTCPKGKCRSIFKWCTVAIMESSNRITVCLILEFSDFYAVFFVSPFTHKHYVYVWFLILIYKTYQVSKTRENIHKRGPLDPSSAVLTHHRQQGSVVIMTTFKNGRLAPSVGKT